jgi:hypothetical protein
MALNADKNCCACSRGELLHGAFSPRAVWWEFYARLCKYLERQCSTERSTRRRDTPQLGQLVGEHYREHILQSRELLERRPGCGLSVVPVGD